ncbi:MAG: ferritin [Bacteroidota bacterium]
MEKQIITPNRSLTDKTEQILNDQISLEGISSSYYLAMASWCDKKGYSNSADFLYKHAEEERQHMLKIFHYVNDAGGHAIHSDITGVRYEYDSLREVFESVLNHEIEVTKAINILVDHCLSIKDYATYQFLQWYVTEQREEEMIARRAVELFDIIGEEGVGLWTIDIEIGKLEAFAAEAAPDNQA